MMIEELRDRCAVWQQRLRLQDWDVSVEFKRLVDLERNTRAAECEYMWILKVAKISLVDPVDASHTSHWLKQVDQEKSLVHELLHLHFAPFQAAKDSDAEADQELAIEMIAEALVALDRKAS